MTRLVEVDDLSLAFRSQGSWTRVLHGVSFSIDRGEVLGLVGPAGHLGSSDAHDVLFTRGRDVS